MCFLVQFFTLITNLLSILLRKIWLLRYFRFLQVHPEIRVLSEILTFLNEISSQGSCATGKSGKTGKYTGNQKGPGKTGKYAGNISHEPGILRMTVCLYMMSMFQQSLSILFFARARDRASQLLVISLILSPTIFAVSHPPVLLFSLFELICLFVNYSCLRSFIFIFLAISIYLIVIFVMPKPRGKSTFQSSWLTHPDYASWVVRDPSSKHHAKCKLCTNSKPIDVSSMGVTALKSHAGGKTHSTLALSMNQQMSVSDVFAVIIVLK